MDDKDNLLAILVVVLPVLCCVPLARARRPGRVAVLLALVAAVDAIAWDRAKGVFEGPTLLVLNGQHGITIVDLVVPVALCVSAAVIWRHLRG